MQQFVNKVQQIVIVTTSDDGSQATKNPVVEHKGWDALLGFGVVFCCSGCGSCGMRFDGPASRSGCAVDFTSFSVPHSLCRYLYK